MTAARSVVVGGSIAALTAAETLRLHGQDGPITLVSDETHQPYSRVPLSKTALAAGSVRSQAQLPAASDDIEIRLNSRAERLDLTHRRVHLAGGEQLPFDDLVIATGARARRLRPPGSGELVLRTLDDAAALTGRLAHAKTVLVIGGGFLGMEIASTCRALGKTVTVIDRNPPLVRLLGTWLAAVLTDAAREQGIAIMHAPDGVTLQPASDKIHDVHHAGGTISADVVISAVGDQPNIEWLHDSGLDLAEGVVVDEYSRAAPNVVAVGDVAVRRINGALQSRLPHWTNAIEQAQAAARTLLDPQHPAAYRPDHYFWTEQNGLDIKISGQLP